MRRSIKKQLAVLLALLVGLTPLQGAMAGLVDLPGQPEGVIRMAADHDGRFIAAEHAAVQDCERCNRDTGCNGQGCSSGHCAACALALLPTLPLPTYRSAAAVPMQTDAGFEAQLSSYLFRPPRAWPACGCA